MHVCGPALEAINRCIINVLCLYPVITHEEVAFTEGQSSDWSAVIDAF